ncbi:hypothetical protein D3C72_2336880 [compost metagenome]
MMISLLAFRVVVVRKKFPRSGISPRTGILLTRFDSSTRLRPPMMMLSPSLTRMVVETERESMTGTWLPLTVTELDSAEISGLNSRVT